ncbi:hypothetical protein [Streptomyces roseus]|uniref:Uncharacterized protein n=1 Tax=Streptomyces roseus TaxID=66430 RepID=A0A0J6XXR5_9ACTN|nr:hypothetical protein [Streptomyces roseus]KMO99022.1 hypothetical protein ACS04_04670 [Streptomyces roseus]
MLAHQSDLFDPLMPDGASGAHSHRCTEKALDLLRPTVLFPARPRLAHTTERSEALRAPWMQWYPNTQLEVLPNTGHYAPEESAEAAAAAVEPYLGR